VNDGKDGWECGCCGKIISPRHASRALRHVLKIKKADIAVCKAAIPDRYLARYQALYDSGKGRINLKKRSSKFIGESVALLQESAVGTLMKKRGIAVSDSARHLSSVSPLLLTSLGACMSAASVKRSRHKLFALSSSSQRTLSTMNMDIQKSNNATVEMAIADFFHCENIPDLVVESPRFKRLVRMCRLVGEDFVGPIKRILRVSCSTSIMPTYTSKTRPNSSSFQRYLGWRFWVMVPLSIKWLL
jgi:hypothetical protein